MQKKDILGLGHSLEEQTIISSADALLCPKFHRKPKKELIVQDNEILFGQTFYYKKIFMWKIGEEYVTVEESVEGAKIP